MLNDYKDYWQEIKDCTMTTISKTTGKYPDSDWKMKLLICEHSPIRRMKINWKWNKLKSWVSVHIVRHKIGIEHWISTRRTDRTGIDRNALRQDELVSHEIEVDAQAMINISRKRLCNQASKETREAWGEVVNSTKDKEPELYTVCVPECIYRCGCSEFKNCGMFNKFKEECDHVDFTNIRERYEEYKRWSSKNG